MQQLRAQKARPKVITLGYCYSGAFGVAGMWHQSVVKFLATAGHMGFGVREMPSETGPFLSRARNHILERHLEYGDDYLLFSDTDTIFRPEDVGLLLEADAAIAGALYYAAAADQPLWATALVEDEELGGDAMKPIVLPELPKAPKRADFERLQAEDAEAAALGHDLMLTEEGWRGMVAAYQAELEAPEYQPQVVKAVGTGMMLIKHEVAVAMREEFEHPFEYVGDTGEDVIFCLRAAELGFETVLVPQARIGHLKGVII